MKTIVLPNSTIALLNGFAAEQRGRTINWLRLQLGLSRSDAEDVFQDSFLILYENLANGTLAELPRSLSAYMNETCRRKALELLRDNEKKRGKGTTEAESDHQNLEEGKDETIPFFDDSLLDEVLEMDEATVNAERVERQESAVREVVRELPDPCNKLLWGYYFENLSMKDMASMYGYKSPESVKVMKSRCMTRFETRMREVYKRLFNE